MRNIRLAFCLLAGICIHAGCSQTGGVRPTAPPSNVRTVASVGDKPLPSVSGEPGASLRADSDNLDLPPSSGTRISGRVYDERGKPVPNAKVRLAVTSTPGGKATYATTDRAGAFTLRGLHAGTSYAVIAEYQGEDGMMTGRTQAKAPQTGVRISLRPGRDDSSAGHASIQPARSRVEPISEIDPVEDENDDDSRTNRKVNTEDLELPPDDATALAPRRNVRLSRAGNDTSSGPARGVWSSRQLPAQNSGTGKTSSQDESAESAPASAGSNARNGSGSHVEDDGPNPLPPAVGSTEVSSTGATEDDDSRPVRLARNRTRASTSAGRRSASRRLDDDDKATGIMAGVGEREPRSMPDDIVPGTKVITPRSSAPVAFEAQPQDDGLASRSLRSTGRSNSQGSDRSVSPAGDADPSEPPDTAPTTIDSASLQRARPTWAEVARNQSKVPLDESIERTSANLPGSADRGVVTLTGKAPATRTGLARLLGGSNPLPDSAVKPAVCRFDPTKRQLVDFQLPGIDGKTVSLHDISADVILLDFWGSWCAPCRTSIAHLTELQRNLVGKRLQVIGIACEKGATLEERQASATRAMQELGINYPVLLSSKEGVCPVQQALQIQFYPTMILLDHDGQVLAREQGATEVTMSRLDRAIETALHNHERAASARTTRQGN